MIRSFYSTLVRSVDNPDSTVSGKRPVLSSTFVFRVIVSVGVLVFLITWLPTDALFGALKSVPPLTWLAVVAFFAIGHAVSALKWRMMLRATGVKVRVGLAVRAHFAGLFANLCLPSIVGGDVIRAAIVIREQKSNLAAITLSSLADRLNDVIALLVIASVASLLLPSAEESMRREFLVIFATLLLFGIVSCVAFVRLVPKRKLPKFLHSVFEKVRQALDSLIMNPLIALFGLILSLLIQSGFVGLNIVLANAMAIDAPALLWAFAWPLAKLVALAPVSLGGLGVREIALAGILAPFGIDASLAVAQSLSWEIVLIFTGLTAGIAVALIPTRLTLLNRNKL